MVSESGCGRSAMSEKEVRELVGELGRSDEITEEMLEEDEGQGRKVARVFKREGRIFLVVWEGSDPLRIEVKTDEKLGKLLREKYESVLDSITLGRGGIEVICTGQLSSDEVVDLVKFSWAHC